MAKVRTGSVAFSLYAAKAYIQKKRLAERSGHQFALTLGEFFSLVTCRYCYYTGVEMTHPNISSNGVVCDGVKAADTDLTLDRVDNKKGYVKGNVVACTRAANNVKSMFESGSYPLSVKDLISMGHKLHEFNF